MRLSIIALILGLCLGILALWQYNRAEGLASQLAQSEQALEAAQKRTKTIQAQVQKTNTASQKARQVVKEKLDAVPEYRDAAVPEPVRDSLCATLRCN